MTPARQRNQPLLYFCDTYLLYPLKSVLVVERVMKQDLLFHDAFLSKLACDEIFNAAYSSYLWWRDGLRRLVSTGIA